MRTPLLTALLALGLIAAAPVDLDRARRDEIRADGAMAMQSDQTVAAAEMVRLTRWQIFLGWLTAAGLGASLVMTNRALGQTRESLGLARAAMLAELRPYLAIDTFKLEMSEGRWTGVYRVKNWGSTPASGIRWRTWGKVVQDIVYVVENPDPAPREGIRTADIAPGASQIFFFTFSEEEAAAMNQIRLGLASVCIDLVVDYSDDFHRSHQLHQSEIRYGEGLGKAHNNRAIYEV